MASFDRKYGNKTIIFDHKYRKPTQVAAPPNEKEKKEGKKAM